MSPKSAALVLSFFGAMLFLQVAANGDAITIDGQSDATDLYNNSTAGEDFGVEREEFGVASEEFGVESIDDDESHVGHHGARILKSIKKCPDGKKPCKKKCGLNFMTDHKNCGKCGKKCKSWAVCTQGVCTCKPGLVPCKNKCVNLKGDAMHCASALGSARSGRGAARGNASTSRKTRRTAGSAGRSARMGRCAATGSVSIR